MEAQYDREPGDFVSGRNAKKEKTKSLFTSGRLLSDQDACLWVLRSMSTTLCKVEDVQSLPDYKGRHLVGKC